MSAQVPKTTVCLFYDHNAEDAATDAATKQVFAAMMTMKKIDDVAALKQEDGPNLIVQGSSTIYPGLLAAGLIDRLMLMTFPVTLGKGKRLFGDGTPSAMLRMVDHKVTAKGTVIATYERGGTLPVFPQFGPQPSTSWREAERQRRMAEGSW